MLAASYSFRSNVVVASTTELRLACSAHSPDPFKLELLARVGSRALECFILPSSLRTICELLPPSLHRPVWLTDCNIEMAASMDVDRTPLDHQVTLHELPQVQEPPFVAHTAPPLSNGTRGFPLFGPQGLIHCSYGHSPPPSTLRRRPASRALQRNPRQSAY